MTVFEILKTFMPEDEADSHVSAMETLHQSGEQCVYRNTSAGQFRSVITPNSKIWLSKLS